MKWQLVWTAQAIRDLRRLDPQIRHGVVLAVERYAETEQGDVRRLVPPLYGYRLRYRDWRVSFDCDAEAEMLTIQWVRHRRDAYRRE